MPLVSMVDLLTEARRGKYAVCYCESWNLESFQAVAEAAEEARSPVIAGFNGGFLMHPARRKPEDLAYYAGLGAVLRRGQIPTAFLLNETDSFTQIEQAIALGFNAVMVENEHLGGDQYRDLVKRVVRIAHANGVSVEAAVGRLPSGCGGNGRDSVEITDPQVARAFVEETGIDALGVSVGNVHVLTSGKASIDLHTLERIHREVNVFLVLHGGTSFPLELAKEVVSLGVAKVNFGTLLKQAYLKALKEKIDSYRADENPHPFLGEGGRQDVLIAGREAIKRKVFDLFEAFGSRGTASATNLSAAERRG